MNVRWSSHFRLVGIFAALSCSALSGCATNFDPDSARNIRVIGIEVPPNPDGYIWPYNLTMFRSSPSNPGIDPIDPAKAAVGGLFAGFANGVDAAVNRNALVSADEAFKFTDERVGDEMAEFMAKALKEDGYEVFLLDGNTAPSIKADATLTITINALGYACDGFFLDGQCKPRLDSQFVLKDMASGKRLYNKHCSYGIKSALLGDCSMEADQAFIIPKIDNILADPKRSNASIREATKTIVYFVAKDLARH